MTSLVFSCPVTVAVPTYLQYEEILLECGIRGVDPLQRMPAGGVARRGQMERIDADLLVAKTEER